MTNIWLSPPIAFTLILIISLGFAASLSRLSFKPRTKEDGCGKSYACGEEMSTNLMQPDYSQFFPFAFFFTILHVVALIIATVPAFTAGTAENIGSFSIAVMYLLGAVVAMLILFRK